MRIAVPKQSGMYACLNIRSSRKFCLSVPHPIRRFFSIIAPDYLLTKRIVMGKIIRPTYPVEFSIGLLILIFALSFFLSSQIFVVSWHELMEGTNAYFGMFLVSVAVIIMVLILWEEFLFPIRIKESGAGVVFRNHRTKLKTQLLIYCIIPIIFVFIYLTYRIHTVRFYIWAAICTIMPLAIKLYSGLNNYNDFLSFTDDAIAYKNNTKTGTFTISALKQIVPIRDENGVLHKFQVVPTTGNEVVIDLDEMELEAFLDSIDAYIAAHYKNLVLEKKAV